MSELANIQGNDDLIVCFGGMALQMGTILPFEFLHFLSSTYHNVDTLFYIDVHQCWYHKGIKDISTNIEETVDYLKRKIKPKYKKIIFMGASSGGYAAILFGSLCNVNEVIAFTPQTSLIDPVNKKYQDLTKFINKKTKYALYCNPTVDGYIHHISHCYHLEKFKNVKIHTVELGIKQLRDNGELKKIIDSTLNHKGGRKTRRTRISKKNTTGL